MSRQRVEFRVTGSMGPRVLSLFAGFDHVVEPVTTALTGEVSDEHELAELCHRLRDAGVELVSLRRLDEVTDVHDDPEGGDA